MKYSLILWVSFFFSGLAQASDVETVEFVDLNRYLGRWYEIASFPQSFQQGCFCSRADYGLRDDGKINVVNSCNKEAPQGELSVANGYAEVVDTKTNSKLKVTFFWPFFGDYWIIGLDDDYRYAVISNPERTSLWILSRTPSLNAELLQKALDQARGQGLDLSKLRFSDNSTCRY